MDDRRFDTLTRKVQTLQSRRATLGHGLAAFIALGFAMNGGDVDARKKSQKKKRKTPAVNAYGCLDVGRPCGGNSALCCSGNCQGKKPKKGKRDTRICAAHNSLSCTDGQDSCIGGNKYCGTTGICLQTTGQADYCGMMGICANCQKDADCEATRGPGAACVVCAAACPGTGGSACYAAAT